MKKCITTLVAFLILIVCLSVAAGAGTEGLVIEGDVVTGYTGSETNVIIPESVNSIAPGAFGPGSADSVTVLNYSCEIGEGAIDPGITVVGYPASTAFDYTYASGNPFAQFSGFSVTLKFYDESGNVIYADIVRNGYYPGDSYELSVPKIDGYTPDRTVVSGVIGEENRYEIVSYTKNTPPETKPPETKPPETKPPETQPPETQPPETQPPTPPTPVRETGWVIEIPYILYYDADIPGYVKDSIRTIDGYERTFDSNGYLVMSGDMITIGSDTFCLVGNKVQQGGYVHVGDGVYFIGSDGRVLKNAVDGDYKYGKDGRMSTTARILPLPDGNYYIDGDRLRKGYIGVYDDIYYFGDDYKAVTGKGPSGLEFDSEGRLVSGVKVDDLQIETEESRTYNGEEQTPDVDVYFKGIKLKKDKDFSLEYYDNVKPGTATVKIVGTGRFSGEKELTFEIIGKETYTLTIKYQDERGYPKAKNFVKELKAGEKYEVESPVIKGYKLIDEKQKKVSGKMPEEDHTEVVLYELSGEETEPSTDTGPETEPEPTAETEKEKPAETENKSGDGDVSEGRLGKFLKFLIVFVISTSISIALIVIVVKFNKIKAFFAGLFGKKKKKVKDNKKKKPDGEDGVKVAHQLPHSGSGAAGAAGASDDLDMSKTIKFDISEIADVSAGVDDNVPVQPIKRKKTVYHFRKK